MNDPAIIGVLGVVLGVVLGWALNRWTNRSQERRREEQVRRSVRLLLRLECSQNLAALFKFWGNVSSPGVHLPEVGELVGVASSGYEDAFDRHQRLAREPLPAWGRLMWESQVDKAEITLSWPEIDRVYTLYSDLEAFAARRAEMRAVFESPDGEKYAHYYSLVMLGKQQGNPKSGASPEEFERDQKLIPFNERTRPLWNECKAIYERVLPYKDNIDHLLTADAPILRRRDRLKGATAAQSLGTSKQTEAK
jgi:hypothetical protein